MTFRIFIVLILFFGSNVWGQKILKIQGNKAVFSTKNLNVDTGDILTITSDGFEAGKLKVLKVGSKAAVGKIIEGSALKGDVVSGGSGGGSGSEDTVSDDSSQEEDAPKKKSGKKSRSKKGNFGFFAGYSLNMMSNIASDQGDYAQDALGGFILKGVYQSGDTGYIFGLQQVTGSAEFTPSITDFTIINADVSTLNLFARLSKQFNKSFYYTYGAQLSMVKIDDTLTSGIVTGQHTLELMGLGGLGGAGYNLPIGPVILQAEALLEINYYFNNTTSLPAGISGNGDAGTFSTYGFQFNFSVGYFF